MVLFADFISIPDTNLNRHRSLLVVCPVLGKINRHLIRESVEKKNHAEYTVFVYNNKFKKVVF